MTLQSDRWVLPEGVDEVLAPESWRLEAARRRLLDMYRLWGYELIRPPLIEYLESLLVGAGRDLDLQTFKLTDQLNGRMMGVRSDMTMQAARIDARGEGDAPARYCYLGSILRTRPEGPGGSRSPLQIGAELFGHKGVDSDIEILSLMLESLRAVGIADVYLDLGHVVVYRSLVHSAGLSDDAEAALFDIIQRKSAPDLQAFINERGLQTEVAEKLLALMELNGGPEVIDIARERLGDAGAELDEALETLGTLARRMQAYYPEVPLHIDLAELRGYRYKTGVVFAAFTPGHGRELARGGRYDDIGASFGRARPATGFSADLNALAAIGELPAEASTDAVYAPAEEDEGLFETVRQLREEGRRVIIGLPGIDVEPRQLGCDSRLVKKGDGWQIKPL